MKENIMVGGISFNLLQNYVTYVNKNTTPTEDMFKELSKELGGDGETITKEQLDNYIKDSKDTTGTKMTALKSLQSNWKDVSDGKDSISANDMGKYNTLLATLYTSDIISSINPNKDELTNFSVVNYLIDKTFTDVNSISKSELNKYLKDLISENSDETDNGDEIDMITNVLADFSKLSANSEYITSDTLKAASTNEYEA